MCLLLLAPSSPRSRVSGNAMRWSLSVHASQTRGETMHRMCDLPSHDQPARLRPAAALQPPCPSSAGLRVEARLIRPSRPPFSPMETVFYCAPRVGQGSAMGWTFLVRHLVGRSDDLGRVLRCVRGLGFAGSFPLLRCRVCSTRARCSGVVLTFLFSSFVGPPPRV